MKSTLKLLFSIALFALFCFTSCQDEDADDTNINEEQLIVPNSTLANLMTFTSSNDGSVDDILDGANCFSVNLPVTIVVNDITIVINTLEDLELIEDLFEEFEEDDDLLEFLFPITIILNDFTEIVIENEDQLEDFIEECTDDDDEEVIECVDFQYPISFSIYNADFQIIDTVTVNSDEELYEFLENLEDNDNGVVLASLNFPVTLIYANGDTIEVNSNQELEAAINAAEDDCDDDEECDVNLEDLEAYLLECGIEADFSNDNELDELYFNFNEEGVLIVNGTPAVTETAAWTLSETEDGYILSISGLQTFEIANGDWLLDACDEDDDELELEFVQLGENETITMELEQNCDDEDDCSEEEVDAYLTECSWRAVSYNGDDNFISYEFFFSDNDELVVLNDNNDQEVIGGWFTSETDNGQVELHININDPLSDFFGFWIITECDEDRLEMEYDGNTLVFEQDECDDENPFECFESLELTFCDDTEPQDDGTMEFDLELIYAECINNNNIVVTYHESSVDAENSVNSLVSPYTNTVAFAQGIYARAELIEDSNVFEVFEIWLNIEECNAFECFESFEAEIVECDTNGDGFAEFNFTQVYANCITDQTIVSYYLTQQDAEEALNSLPLEGYTNNANPQTIYARVEIGSEFQIFTVTLIVEDCSNSTCSEEDVDAYLVECIWNVVNFNGSDDLIIYDMDFEANSGIVVIFTDTETIDASWSTSQTNDGVVVEFSNVAGANIQAISGSWLVVECEEDRLELHKDNDFMVIERTCN